MKKRRRPLEIFSLSFLDVVSCGFGAIVLLLVIVKVSEPVVAEQASADLSDAVAALQAQNEELRQEAAALSATLGQAAASRAIRERERAELEAEYSRLLERREATRITAASREAIVRQLHRARQELTEEIRRLQAVTPPPPPSSLIGGVPVDSEFIIFVIDTSGSMQQFAWPAVRKKMREVLEIYPRVQGIQVMNDMGDYMFSQYAGRWIPDTPARRKAILARLSGWAPFSNSSPVEGITAAIRRFYAEDKKISIYVFGDDFSRGSIQGVVDTVDAINRSARDGSRRVRIHAVGFPVLFDQPGAETNVARFAALMRRLAEDNDGSFVGLTSLR